MGGAIVTAGERNESKLLWSLGLLGLLCIPLYFLLDGLSVSFWTRFLVSVGALVAIAITFVVVAVVQMRQEARADQSSQ